MTIDTSSSRAPSKTLIRDINILDRIPICLLQHRETFSFGRVDTITTLETFPASRCQASKSCRVSAAFRSCFGRPRRGPLRYTRGTPRERPSDHAARRARFSRAFLRSDKERIRMAPRSRSAHECSSAAGFDGAGRDRAQRTAAPRRPRVCARADTRRPRAMCTRIGGYTRG